MELNGKPGNIWQEKELSMQNTRRKTVRTVAIFVTWQTRELKKGSDN